MYKANSFKTKKSLYENSSYHIFIYCIYYHAKGNKCFNILLVSNVVLDHEVSSISINDQQSDGKAQESSQKFKIWLHEAMTDFLRFFQ